MKRLFKSAFMGICLSLALASSVLLLTPAQAQSGALNLIPPAPPALPLIPSNPLELVSMPSRTGFTSSALAPMAAKGPSGGMLFRLLETPAAQTCSPATIDLKVLIITADPTDTQTALPAIKQALDYQGTPYTVFTASPRPTDPAANRLASLLSSGCHAFYQGVILGNGQVAYSDPTAGWQSALTTSEWQTLWTYERSFNIRQVTWYTYPTSDYGFNPPNSSGDTTSSPISASYTGAGQAVYTYANTANPLTIQNVWAYKATPLDASTSTLLQDSASDALVAIKTYTDGTQNLAMTFDGNPNITHTLVLAYGAVNWVTNGLFLGERHIFMTPQVDDIFIDAHVWSEGTPCGTNPETTKEMYRITGSDLQAVINWQGATQAQPTTNLFRLDMMFNGEGTNGSFNPDTLTPMAQTNQGLFKWTNHTYTHANLDNTSYNTTLSEITQNNQVAQQLGLTTYNIENLITPDVSGLNNPNAMQAAWDAGVRYLVSDTSVAGGSNPSPNIGIYNASQPGILEIPRRPSNLFYNVTNPQQWTEEYNCLYSSFWGRNLAYAEILDKESAVLVHYMLLGEIDPWMFHETNLRAYDGTHSLLGDLSDQILTKYNALFALPTLSPTMDDLGGRMAGRMAYSSAGVTASIVPGKSITITSQQNVVVPVTGLNTVGAESYGGQPISHVSLAAGQTITIGLTQGGQAPVAQNDSYTATKNVTLNVAAPGVLANDSDPDGDTLIAVPVSNPSNGALTLNANGSFTYTPKTGFTGADTFTYKAQDPLGTASNPATVTIQVKEGIPVANNDAYTMNAADISMSVKAPGVLANDSDPDGDPLTATLVTSTSNGALSFNADGSFTYTPLPSLTSFSDSFTYQAQDAFGAKSNVATVTIQVNEALSTTTPVPPTAPAPTVTPTLAPTLTVIPTTAPAPTATQTLAPTPTADPTATSTSVPAPVANNDSYSMHSLSLSLTVPAPGVLGNDTDSSGQPLTAVLVSNPSNGTLTLNADGSFTYTPNLSLTSFTDSFTYKAFDGTSYSNVATVTINVTVP